MSAPFYTCERGLVLLHLFILSRWPGPLLQKIYVCKDLNHGGCPFDPCDSGRLFRLCSALRPNKILGGDGHYQPFLGFSILWPEACDLIVGGVCGR